MSSDENFNFSHVPLWDMDVKELKAWIKHSKSVGASLRIVDSIKKRGASSSSSSSSSPKRPKAPLEGADLVSSNIDAFEKELSEDKVADNVVKALVSGCEGHDIYKVLSKSEAKGINAQLKPGAVLMRADLEALLNSVVGQAGGVIDLDDKSVATSKVEEMHTTNKRGVVIPKLVQELARVLKRKVAARVEVRKDEGGERRVASEGWRAKPIGVGDQSAKTTQVKKYLTSFTPPSPLPPPVTLSLTSLGRLLGGSLRHFAPSWT